MTKHLWPAEQVDNSVLQSRNPDKNFVQSCKPDGYIWRPTSHTYFQSRISPQFYFRISNPELQIKEIPVPEEPIGDPDLDLSTAGVKKKTDENLPAITDYYCKSMLRTIWPKHDKIKIATTAGNTRNWPKLLLHGQFARRNKVLYKIENWNPQYFHGKYIYHKQHHCQFLLRRVRKTLHLTIIRDSERKGNNF